ncbi:MAG: hypothetical protein WC549_07610, partial [Actinomycetota bacterium]
MLTRNIKKFILILGFICLLPAVSYSANEWTWLTDWQDISNDTTGSWTDIDLGTGDIVPSGTNAVIVVFTGAAGARCNGSTSSFQTSGNLSKYFFVIKIDSNRIFEQYISSTSTDCYLVAYTDLNNFDTNWTAGINPSSDVWTDVDLSGTYPGASGVFIALEHSSGYNSGARKNGSTDSLMDSREKTVFVGVDSSQILEVYENPNWASAWYYDGCFKDEAIFNTNVSSITLSSTGTWETKDLSAYVDANATGAFFYIKSTDGGTARQAGIFANDSSNTYTCTIPANGKGMYCSKLDSNKQVKIYRETSSITVYYAGCTK